MVDFTDLPDELLLQIVSYHSPSPLSISSKPFGYWPRFLNQYRTLSIQQIKPIKSLAQTSKHFHDILFPFIHETLFLFGTYNCNGLRESLFGANPNERLGQIIKTAHLSDVDPEACVFLFFNLPNLRIVRLDSWTNWEAFDESEHIEPDEQLAGNSPITTLYLNNCGAREAPLKQLLSWPAALKELWLEVDQVEWEGYVDGEAPGFECEAISRALEPTWPSLEKFVFTRTDPNHEGLYYVDAINLRNFQKLKELELFHVLLVGYDNESGIWENLPASLESLSVWFDDAGYKNFLVGDPAGMDRPEWLMGILSRKKERFERLERVRVVSIEWFDEEQAEWDDGEGGEGMEKGMPVFLKDAFLDAGVSYSIRLKETGECWKEVVDGGMGFDEDWDEKIIEVPNRV